jgi:hypothetical protein
LVATTLIATVTTLVATTLLVLSVATSITTSSRTQSQKKFAAFNINQQRVVFLELNCKEGKNM